MANLRRLTTQYEPREFVREAYHGLQDIASCITYNMELLAFGQPSGMSRGDYVAFTPPLESGTSDLLPADASTNLAAAFFSDACPFIAASRFRNADGMNQVDFLARCRAFGSGVLREGLSTTINEFVRRMNLLADERLRARVGSDPSGTGFLLPRAGYNYTVDLGECGSARAANKPLPRECHAAAGYGKPELTTVMEPPDVPDPETWNGDFRWLVDGVVVAPGDWGFNATEPTVRPYGLGNAISSPMMHWIEELLEADKLYVTPAMLSAAGIYSSAAVEGIHSFNAFVVIFTAAYLSGYCVLMLLVYLPQVSSRHVKCQLPVRPLS